MITFNVNGVCGRASRGWGEWNKVGVSRKGDMVDQGHRRGSRTGSATCGGRDERTRGQERDR